MSASGPSGPLVFRYTHTNGVPPNIDLICGFVLIFLCELLSVSDDTDNSELL